MKKMLLLIFLFIFLCISVFSQDLIVTSEHDSVHCRITEVNHDFIYFTFKQEGEYRSTLIPISNVKFYQYDFFNEHVISKENIIGYENYQHIRFGIIGGGSYQLALVSESVHPSMKSYVTELKSGYHFGGDIIYYFVESLGFGFRYNLFKSSNSIDNVYFEDIDGDREYGDLSDDISISFYGPTISIRFIGSNKRNVFLLGLSAGYTRYKNNRIFVNDTKITGDTAGLTFDFTYDIGLTEKLFLGLQISLFGGTLSEFEIDDGLTKEKVELEEGEYENLTRIDFSIGLRFSI